MLDASEKTTLVTRANAAETARMICAALGHEP